MIFAFFSARLGHGDGPGVGSMPSNEAVASVVEGGEGAASLCGIIAAGPSPQRRDRCMTGDAMTSNSDLNLVASNLFNDAMRFLAEGKREVALKYLRQAAQCGHPEAQSKYRSLGGELDLLVGLGAGFPWQHPAAMADAVVDAEIIDDSLVPAPSAFLSPDERWLDGLVVRQSEPAGAWELIKAYEALKALAPDPDRPVEFFATRSGRDHREVHHLRRVRNGCVHALQRGGWWPVQREFNKAAAVLESLKVAFGLK
ncbi:MAG TPA: hypothetical protein VF062_17715 [Candidatus Limnocylindrales bacterium]